MLGPVLVSPEPTVKTGHPRIDQSIAEVAKPQELLEAESRCHYFCRLEVQQGKPELFYKFSLSGGRLSRTLRLNPSSSVSKFGSSSR